MKALVPAGGNELDDEAIAQELFALARERIEAALGGELTDHLGDEPHDPAGRGSGNARNGT
jgi:hypothetical protein